MMDVARFVEDRSGLSWRDALIVAAAKSSGCTHLLTEDLQGGQDLDGLLIASPFSHAPTDLV